MIREFFYKFNRSFKNLQSASRMLSPLDEPLIFRTLEVKIIQSEGSTRHTHILTRHAYARKKCLPTRSVAALLQTLRAFHFDCFLFSLAFFKWHRMIKKLKKALQGPVGPSGLFAAFGRAGWCRMERCLRRRQWPTNIKFAVKPLFSYSIPSFQK